MEKPSISFDEDGRVRVLDAEKFKQTEALEVECRSFVTKIREFSEIVSSIVEVLNAQSQSIEKAKLRAIGQRNLVEGERDARRRKQAQIQALVDEKLAELDRCDASEKKQGLTAQYESLVRVESEQREMIEKLSNNEPAIA